MSIIKTFENLTLFELKLVEEINIYSEELRNNKDFTIYEAFKNIDINDEKYISEDLLQQFMRKNNHNLSNIDIKNLVLRLDNDGDRRISYEEFQEIFFPLKSFNPITKSLDSNFNHLSYSRSNINYSPRRQESSINDSKDYNTGNTKRSIILTSRSAFNDRDANLRSSYTNQSLNLKKSISPFRSNERTTDNFQSTWSTVNKAHFSPYRVTDSNKLNRSNNNIDLNASRHTYTSPLRQSRTRNFSPRRNHVLTNNSFERQNYLYSSVGSLARSIRSPNRFTANSSSSPRKLLNKSLSDLRMTSPNRFGNKSSSFEDQNNKFKSLSLATFFKDLIKLDEAVENAKEALSLRSDVTIKDVFLAFDLTERNSVSLIELKEVLKDLQIYSTIDELKLIFKRFDKDLDGRLK